MACLLTYVLVDCTVGPVYNMYAMKDKKLYSLLYMVIKVSFDHNACRYFPSNMVMVMERYDEGSEKVIAVLSEYFVLVLELVLQVDS